tara:strand:+ start:482 stop:610 length:129 start_codon:yes stop_codon:yes gene_type:complete
MPNCPQISFASSAVNVFSVIENYFLFPQAKNPIEIKYNNPPT